MGCSSGLGAASGVGLELGLGASDDGIAAGLSVWSLLEQVACLATPCSFAPIWTPATDQILAFRQYTLGLLQQPLRPPG